MLATPRLLQSSPTSRVGMLAGLILGLAASSCAEPPTLARPDETEPPPPKMEAAGVGANKVPCKKGRVTVDQTDAVPGYQVHVLYVVPSDGEDAKLDTNGAIASSVAAWDTWLATALGHRRRMRIDRCDGAVDITFFRLTRPDAEIAAHGNEAADEIMRELVAAGFNDPLKTYAIYYGGTNDAVCGSSGVGSRFGAIYLERPGCDGVLAGKREAPRYLEFAMVHEILHADGLVPGCAPHESGGHVSDDPRDLMYEGPEPWAPSLLDANHDDYFEHGRADCFDLAKSAFIDPLPKTPELPESWTPVRTCTAQPLPDSAPAHCSPSDGAATSLVFENGCRGRPVSIVWVSSACTEIPYTELAPGQRVELPTHVGHRWRIRSAETGELLLDDIEAGQGLVSVSAP